MDFKQRNLATNLLDVLKGGGIPVSIEISPPESQTETHRLLSRIDDIYACCHLQFCAVTWHLRNFSNAYGINFKAIQLAHNLQIRNKEVLLHVAAKGLNRENVLHILKELQNLKINNIFALRGDDVDTRSQDNFIYAEQLVRFIRENTREEMVICVAGYPNGHPEGESYRTDLNYLKEKVKAGANFIITQIILEAETLNCFVSDCQDLGINVPILAGIMPIQDYGSFKRMSTVCHLEIPKHIETTLQSIKENPESVKNFGIFHAVMTVKGILSARNSFCGLHFFTMNRSSSLLDIFRYSGLITSSPTKPLATCATATENYFKEIKLKKKQHKFTTNKVTAFFCVNANNFEKCLGAVCLYVFSPFTQKC